MDHQHVMNFLQTFPACGAEGSGVAQQKQWSDLDSFDPAANQNQINTGMQKPCKTAEKPANPASWVYTLKKRQVDIQPPAPARCPGIPFGFLQQRKDYPAVPTSLKGGAVRH